MTLAEIIKKQRMQKDPAFANLQYLERLEELVNAEIKRKVEELVTGKEDEFNRAIDELKDNFQKELGDVIKDIPLIRNQIIKDLKGEDGYTPIKNKDYFDGRTPTSTELLFLIKPLIPKIENGKDAKPEDVVPLVLEKLPPMKELKPDEVVEKINTAEKKVLLSSIEGLVEMFANIKRTLVRKESGGGGMGLPVPQTFTGDGSTTSFTLSNNVAAGGRAIWVYYNGQWLVPTTHFTISGKTISLTFTPENNTSIDVLYFRT